VVTLTRSLSIAGAFVLLAAPLTAQAPVWPIANGSHDVLHSFQNPFVFSQYFHEGVDLRGSLIDVVAVRDGIVRYKNQGDSGGNILVEVSTPSGIESDSYLHVIIDPWLVDDPIQAGDRIGVINDNYFAQLLQDHVHVNRFRGYAGGNGYVAGRTNMLHPLVLFATGPELDPQQLPAGPEDANEDGRTFYVVTNNQTTPLNYAFAKSDLILEATDRLSNTLYWNQGVVGVGYWIEALSGGDDVASALTPYRLLRFDDNWRSSSSDCDLFVGSALLTTAASQVKFGPDNTGWTMTASYRLTETSGFTGAASAISTAQSWVTDARIGGGSANGTGAATAREIAEARFQDGRVRVHALVADLAGEVDYPQGVVVDNWRPYVKTVRVLDGASEVYRSGWSFDSGTGQLSFARRFSADYEFTLGEPVTLEIEFSEPMASATLALAPALGIVPALSSAQGPEERRLWSTTFTLANLPARHHLARLTFTGTDLAGTTLFPFASTATLNTPFNKRANATAITTPTTDTLHVLPLARRRGTSGPP
jgi:hypothetical protein